MADDPSKVALVDMRVCARRPNGLSRHAIEAMRYLVGRGYQPRALILNDEQAEVISEMFPDVVFERSRYHPIHFLSIFAFERAVRRFKPKVIYSPYYCGRPFRRPPGSLHFMMCHDLMYRVVPGYLGRPEPLDWMMRTYLDLWLRFNLRSATHVLSASPSARHDLLDFGFDSQVIDQGGGTLPAPAAWPSKLPPQIDAYCLYVGSSRPHKNLPRLIRAHATAGCTEWLVLAGVEPAWAAAEIARAGATRCTVVAYPTDQELADLYGSASFVVVPSLYEGFGMPVIEAWRFGRRVTCSNGGSLANFGSELCHYFDPLDESAMAKALEDMSAWSPDPEQVRQAVSRFNWDRTFLSLQALV